MENKNVFIAIALSMSVLLFWGAFVETPQNKNPNKDLINQRASGFIVRRIFIHALPTTSWAN